MNSHPFHKLIATVLFLSVAALATPTVYEAENQELNTNAIILDSTGVSGNQYVQSNGITFRVTVENTGIYDLIAQIWVKQYDWFNTSIFINNGTNAIASFLTNSPNTAYTPYTLTATAKLQAGDNSITISGGTTNFDYLSVEPHPSVVFNLSAAPIVPEATLGAYKVKSFLTNQFGKKTIAGMMIGDNAFNYDYSNMQVIEKCVPTDSCQFADSLTTFLGQEDIRLFKEKTGKHPALGGFDMIFATGGHSDEGWFLGYTENSIRMAKQLWELGGIPAFTWHWKVGKDTVFYTKSNGFNNQACIDGVAGSSTDNTCFNYTHAFFDTQCQEPNTNSSEYQLLMADVDTVSKWFLQLQNDGIAAIWRPLHEAAGGWFWWGVAGSTCYQSLYKLVFDRMVHTNGVKNLIWVWNIERDPKIGYDYSALSSSWYPGDDYVDVIGVDIYNNSGDIQSNINHFSKIVTEMGSHKILALTENGPIPDVDSMATDGAIWSWWMPWYNTWDSGFLNQTPNSVWSKNLKDPRIISLDDMPGWENVEVSNLSYNGQMHSPVKITMHDRSLHIHLSNGSATVSLYNIMGQRLLKTIQSHGSNFYDLYHLVPGQYIVQVQGAAIHTTQWIVIR